MFHLLHGRFKEGHIVIFDLVVHEAIVLASIRFVHDVPLTPSVIDEWIANPAEALCGKIHDRVSHGPGDSTPMSQSRRPIPTTKQVVWETLIVQSDQFQLDAPRRQQPRRQPPPETSILETSHLRCDPLSNCPSIHGQERSRAMSAEPTSD